MINIIRSEKKGKAGYTCIYNEILQSKDLKPHEIGVLVHLLSLPIDFVIHKSSIWKQMNIGRDQFDKAWKNLVRLRYIQTIQYRNDDLKNTFGYRHIVYETPQYPENQCTDSQDTENQCLDSQDTENQCTDNQDTENQYTDNQDIRTLISSNWIPVCIESNNTKDTGTVSNSRNGVEVRHGQKILDQKVLDQKILGPKILEPEIIEEDLPIVPPPSLRFGSVRDNEEEQNRTTSTEPPVSDHYVNTSTVFSVSGRNRISIEERMWDSNNVTSIKDPDFWPEGEADDIDINNFRIAIDDLYKDKFPNWQILLKEKPLHTFLQETCKIHTGVPEIIEMISILKHNLK